MIEHNHKQNSPKWFKARLSLPTASCAKKLITSKGQPSTQVDKYAQLLAQEKYTGKPVEGWSGNKDTSYGHEYEQEAALYYSMATNVGVFKMGFCTDDLGRYGASPDRGVEGGGLLEIKCFPKTHMESILYWHANKKPQSSEIAQPHNQMLVCDEPWCDLLYYHPDLPKIIIRINRSSDMDSALKLQINKVIAKRDDLVKKLQEIAA